MPFYEFVCTGCQHTFTVRTSFAGKKDVLCPECHSKQLKETYDGYGGGSAKASSGAAVVAPRSPFR